MSNPKPDGKSTKPFPAKHSFPGPTFPSATTSFGSTATSVSLYDPRISITTANTSFTSIATDADSVADDKITEYYTSHLPDFSEAESRIHQYDADLASTVSYSQAGATLADTFAQAGVYGKARENERHKGMPEDQLMTNLANGAASERKDGASLQIMHYQVRDLPNQDLVGEHVR